MPSKYSLQRLSIVSPFLGILRTREGQCVPNWLGAISVNVTDRPIGRWSLFRSEWANGSHQNNVMYQLLPVGQHTERMAANTTCQRA
jgi:hypothetical protein